MKLLLIVLAISAVLAAACFLARSSAECVVCRAGAWLKDRFLKLLGKI